MKISRYLLVILLVVFQMKNLWGCTCIGKSSLMSRISRADVIFTGIVVSNSVFTIINQELKGLALHLHKYTLLVNERFKGVGDNATIEVITGIGHGDCGFPLDLNGKYLIYSWFENKYWPRGELVKRFIYTDICSGTKYLKYSKKELRLLRKITKAN